MYELLRTVIYPDRNLEPVKTAGLIAAVYSSIAGFYIWISGALAERLTDSAEKLYQVEFFKGLLFIFITGILLFLLVRYMLHKIHKFQQQMKTQQQELMQSERRALSGMIASSIAHDINNILSVSNGLLFKLKNHTRISHDQKEYIESLQKTNTDMSQLQGVYWM